MEIIKVGLAGRVIDVRAVVVSVVPVLLDAAFERDRSANEGRRIPHFRDERLVQEPFCFARQAAQRNSVFIHRYVA